MKRIRKQQGSAQIVIMVCLGITLIAILGWVFWQGFIDTDPKDGSQATSKISAEEDDQSKSGSGESTKGQPSPKVVYTPDSLFDANEKAELEKKLVNPRISYADQFKDDPIISITIEKKTDSDYAAQPSYSKFRYSVDVKNEKTSEGFLFGSNDQIDWWVPDCFDGQCGLTSEFKEMYPDIVARIVARGETP